MGVENLTEGSHDVITTNLTLYFHSFLNSFIFSFIQINNEVLEILDYPQFKMYPDDIGTKLKSECE